MIIVGTVPDKDRSVAKEIMLVPNGSNDGLRLTIDQNRVVALDAVSVTSQPHIPGWAGSYAGLIASYGINQVAVTNASGDATAVAQQKDAISKALGGSGWTIPGGSDQTQPATQPGTDAANKTVDQSQPSKPADQQANKPLDKVNTTPSTLPPGVRKTASGATVHIGSDGLIEKIEHSDGTAFTITFKTENGKRVVEDYSGLPDGAKDIMVYPNGNITYTGKDNKPGEMTIVRGDGTVIKGLSDQPQFHNKSSNFAEYKFDSEGRITHIVPTSQAFWREGARSREFMWKGNTNELAAVSVISANQRYRDQSGQEHFIVFNHQKQANSQWACHDNFGRQLRVGQGERSLARNGVYTTPDVRTQGRAVQEGILIASPEGKDDFKPKTPDKTVNHNKDENGRPKPNPKPNPRQQERQDGCEGGKCNLTDNSTENPTYNSPNTEGMDSFNERFIYLTNLERARYGLQPLTYDASLQPGAAYNSYLMSQAGYSGHFYTENVYQNSHYSVTDPDAAFQEYMNSPHHRDNLMNRNITRIAAGLAGNSNTIQMI